MRSSVKPAPQPYTLPYVQRFRVDFEYPVYFTSELLRCDNPVLSEAVCRLEPERRHRVFVVIDSGVAASHPHLVRDLELYATHDLDRLELVRSPLIIDGGERAKNSEHVVDELRSSMIACHLDRQSPVIAIGGGAVLDSVGYAAATVHRGVRLIRVPTTVESQCDSGVGVKNAINAFSTKNLLGTFFPPFAVINDTAFLATLPSRERRSGSAEAVKVALIRDGKFFAWLADNARDISSLDVHATAEMIRRSAELHLEHIASCGDAFEFASVKPLDFGHWSAHKLETMSSYDLRHGEAVAIGIAIDARYSVQAGLLSESDCEQICELLEQLGFVLWNDNLDAVNSNGRLRVLEGLAEFREHLGGELSLTLLEGIGKGVDVSTIDEDSMQRAIAWLSRRSRVR